MKNTILQGDALSVLRTLPANIAQCCVTSPPYWSLRDYGVAGQIGLEPSPEAFIARLVEVFREVRRVLRPDGVLWLNIGDSYAEKKTSTGLPPKNLLLMPARLALALQADGWWIRSDCIWSKTNPMPEPVKDRPAKSHEYVFLLAKSERYFYDIEATRQPLKPNTITAWGSKMNTGGGDALGKVKSDNWAKSITERKPRRNADGSIAGAAMRSVLMQASQPFKGAHFATFPPKLIEPLILAASSPHACEICHAPWARIVEHTPMAVQPGPKSGQYGSRTTDGLSGTLLEPARSTTTGWKPTCQCENEGSARCLVLDPFCGSGTTALVAQRLGRDYLGVEINPTYIALAEQRLREGK